MIKNIIIGETFWDQYEDGSIYLGGAGLNVAWNLRGLGSNIFFVSRVGEDEMGEKMLHAIEKWGILPTYIQRDPKNPTGLMKVLMDEQKKPTFITPEVVAFDYIEYDSRFDYFSNDSIVYFDSFMLRGESTRNALQKIKNKGFSIFMDLNIRPPYWSHELFDEWVRDLEFFKLSDDEAKILLKNDQLTIEQQVEEMKSFMIERNINHVFLTLGCNGSYWIHDGQATHVETREMNAKDTVGAGDAYCAGILFSYEHGFSMVESIEKASRFAAEICDVHGATSHDQEFYRKCRADIWGL
jgi:fructokinase